VVRRMLPQLERVKKLISGHKLFGGMFGTSKEALSFVKYNWIYLKESNLYMLHSTKPTYSFLKNARNLNIKVGLN
jgi:hypothetical protein